MHNIASSFTQHASHRIATQHQRSGCTSRARCDHHVSVGPPTWPRCALGPAVDLEAWAHHIVDRACRTPAVAGALWWHRAGCRTRGRARWGLACVPARMPACAGDIGCRPGQGCRRVRPGSRGMAGAPSRNLQPPPTVRVPPLLPVEREYVAEPVQPIRTGEQLFPVAPHPHAGRRDAEYARKHRKLSGGESGVGVHCHPRNAQHEPAG